VHGQDISTGIEKFVHPQVTWKGLQFPAGHCGNQIYYIIEVI